MEPSQNADEGDNVFNPLPSSSNENTKKSMEAENLFSIFLDQQKIPYYYIFQKQEKYSGELYKKNISRPDYIIHTEKLIYYIDVKYRKKQFFKNNEYRFYLNKNEIIRLFNFQKTLNMNVWISFINDLKNPQFFYSPISDIYEYYVNIKKYNSDFLDSEELSEIYLVDNEIYKKLFIYIPEKMLYSQLSFEKGIYKEPDDAFFEQEAIDHKSIWEIKKNIAFIL